MMKYFPFFLTFCHRLDFLDILPSTSSTGRYIRNSCFFDSLFCNKQSYNQIRHCVKKCLYSELFWPVFFRIWTEYGDILRISPYSVQMRENTDHNNSKYGHFLRSGLRLLFQQASFLFFLMTHNCACATSKCEQKT